MLDNPAQQLVLGVMLNAILRELPGSRARIEERVQTLRFATDEESHRAADALEGLLKLSDED